MVRRALDLMRSLANLRRSRGRHISDMTKADLLAWAAKHGKTVMDSAELDALCAAAAANLDREYQVICGHE
jgi:hypothetical protein